MPQAAQALVSLNAPLPPPPVAFPACRGNSSRATCLKVLFLTRSSKPAVRQASCCGFTEEWFREGGCGRARVRAPLPGTSDVVCSWQVQAPFRPTLAKRCSATAPLHRS